MILFNTQFNQIAPHRWKLLTGLEETTRTLHYQDVEETQIALKKNKLADADLVNVVVIKFTLDNSYQKICHVKHFQWLNKGSRMKSKFACDTFNTPLISASQHQLCLCYTPRVAFESGKVTGLWRWLRIPGFLNSGSKNLSLLYIRMVQIIFVFNCP